MDGDRGAHDAVRSHVGIWAGSCARLGKGRCGDELIFLQEWRRADAEMEHVEDSEEMEYGENGEHVCDFKCASLLHVVNGVE